MKSRAEVIFLDGPFEASVLEASTDDLQESSSAIEPDGRSWWRFTDAGEEASSKQRPSQASIYSGWDTTREVIRQKIAAEAPIDMILGFSQGTTAAALYCADLTPAEESMLRSVILVSGFIPRDPEYAKKILDTRPIRIRSLHLSGEKDLLVPTERSRHLWGMFEETTRTHFIHPGGHMVPTCTGEVKDILRGFLDGTPR